MRNEEEIVRMLIQHVEVRVTVKLSWKQPKRRAIDSLSNKKKSYLTKTRFSLFSLVQYRLNFN